MSLEIHEALFASICGPDTDLAKLNDTGVVMLLQEDGSAHVTILWVATIGGGFAIDPGLEMVADGNDAQSEPITIFNFSWPRPRAGHAEVVDAAGGIVGVAMVALDLVTRRILLAPLEMRLTANVDPAIAAAACGIKNAHLGEQFEVFKNLKSR